MNVRISPKKARKTNGRSAVFTVNSTPKAVKWLLNVRYFLKPLVFFTILIFSSSVFCQDLSAQNSSQNQNAASSASGALEVPLLLEGVWKNNSRYVVFDTDFIQNDRTVMQEVLKIFYGWYDDRAAEDERYTKEHKRDVNDATSRAPAQQIQVLFHPLTRQLFTKSYGLDVVSEDGAVFCASDKNIGAWVMEIYYPNHKEPFFVPVCVIGDNLYLDFVFKETGESSSETAPGMRGFFRDEGSASGILISPPVNKSELTCYYVTESAVYHIRYWRTDMEYDGVKKAQFSDSGETYEVPKHIKSAGNVYTCVNGRGSKIRNIEKSTAFFREHEEGKLLCERTVYNQDGTASQDSVESVSIIAFGKPYLSRVEGSVTIEQILSEDAKRKRPEAKPLFPPHGLLDFDWSVLDDRLRAQFERMFP